ncbi:MAG: hypothetical protein SGILL_010156, partial [Bacillariaceae sp.]
MASLLSFAWRKNRQHGQRTVTNTIEETRVIDTEIYETDPWGLGAATSTSSSESITPNSQESEKMTMALSPTFAQKPMPSTPEGLRPRKSIHKLRQELLGYQPPNGMQAHRPAASAAATATQHPLTASMSPNMATKASLTSRFQNSLTVKDILSELDYEWRSPQMTLNSSVHSQSTYNGHYEDIYDDDYVDQDEDHDYDIVSMAASPFASPHSGSLSRSSCRTKGSRLVAASPDLQPGKAKTAVGALLAAASISGHGEVPPLQSQGEVKQRERSQRSILPSRRWMDDDAMTEEDETICDDAIDNSCRETEEAECDDESSLHASPSSLRRDRLASWNNHRAQYQHDTSFTRTILTRHLEPYDFGPILTEDVHSPRSFQRSEKDAPCVLALIDDSNGLDVSAISSSYHPRDLASLHSLADTMDDDEDYEEINRYQPLVDDVAGQEQQSDDKALNLLKAQNQRRMKENCLLSTIERLSHDLELLQEVSLTMDKSNKCPSPRNHLFLGLQQPNQETLRREMEKFLFELSMSSQVSGDDIEPLAIRFCLSVMEKSMQTKQKKDDRLPKPPWKSLPGLRSALGLKEDPLSPPTVRGGDSSLFSLPSDSANANDDTPHTSNVSMATTITTV